MHHIYFITLLFNLFASSYFILLAFISCAWQPLGRVGAQDKEVVLHVAWRRTTRAFSTVPRKFDIKPRVPSWGKFTLTTTLCTWSPDELTPLLRVINVLDGYHLRMVWSRLRASPTVAVYRACAIKTVILVRGRQKTMLQQML
jgi:hypothetical protein